MWVLACFYELHFQWQFNFCSLFSFTLIFLVYQVLFAVPLVPGDAAKGSRSGLPRPGSQVYWWRRAMVRSSHCSLLLLVSWVCRDEKSPWTRLPVIAGSLPYPFQCLLLGGNSLRLLRGQEPSWTKPQLQLRPSCWLALSYPYQYLWYFLQLFISGGTTKISPVPVVSGSPDIIRGTLVFSEGVINLPELPLLLTRVRKCWVWATFDLIADTRCFATVLFLPSLASQGISLPSYHLSEFSADCLLCKFQSK